MQALSIIVPSPEPPETKVTDLNKWEISAAEAASYLLFFDKIAYVSGTKKHEMLNEGDARFKLTLPDDPALNGRVIGIYANSDSKSLSDVVVEKIGQRFTTAPDDRWICHPSIVARLDDRDHPFKPAVGVEFLEGLFCPTGEVNIGEILEFKEERSAEREAFFAALYEASEAVEVGGRKVSVSIDMKRLNGALADLNKSIGERWAEKVKRSFTFRIRPNEKCLGALAVALMAHQATGNLGASVLAALYGSVEFSVDLTPQVEKQTEFTTAMTFAWAAQKRFS